MEQTDPLSQLKDIHLPDPVGLWPLAWGWWLLLVLIILVITTGIFLLRRTRARNRYRALASVELRQAKLIFDQDKDTASYLQHVSIILRRAALTGCGDSYHANLSGEAWLQWLDDQYASKQKNFTEGPGRVLLLGPYQKAPEADVDLLHKLAIEWLAQHRNQWQKKHSSFKRLPALKMSGRKPHKHPRDSEATSDA